jgi:hypothetical protein
MVVFYEVKSPEVPGDLGSQISRQTEHEGSKVRPTHRPALLIFLEAEPISWPKCGRKDYSNKKVQ